MVRAILAGKKTQTRRVCSWPGGALLRAEPCPFGQSGDQLWVREPFRLPSYMDERSAGNLAELHPIEELRRVVEYISDENDPRVNTGRYRHGRFMPRWACRITLELTAVRIERLQEISGDDAIKEGIEVDLLGKAPLSKARWMYRELWDSLNAKLGHGWDVNPWLWVLEFRRLT